MYEVCIQDGKTEVEMMEKKEKIQYLQDYRWVVARIAEIDNELSKPIAVDDVQYNGVKAEKDAVKHVSKGERLQAERDKLVGKKQRIEDAIKAVNSSKESILLHFMYISGKSAKEVAVDMKIPIRTIYRIHDSAIKNVVIKEKESER